MLKVVTSKAPSMIYNNFINLNNLEQIFVAISLNTN